jgi:hypothetical protein
MGKKVVPCAGDGLAVEDGAVTVYGPRDLKWKLGTGSCNIDAHNGLKVDPSTHKMWVSPDTDVRWAQYGTKVESYVPKNKGSHAYTPIKLSLTTRDCTKTHARLRLSNGLSHFFMNPGDYWVQRCTIEAKINGTSTHSTSETVAFACPATTIFLGIAHPDFLMTRTLEPNTTIDVTIRYFLDILAVSNTSENRVDLRSANVNLSYWSFPI